MSKLQDSLNFGNNTKMLCPSDFVDDGILLVSVDSQNAYYVAVVCSILNG